MTWTIVFHEGNRSPRSGRPIRTERTRETQPPFNLDERIQDGDSPMMLRLVMVSLVAALGLELPTRSDLDDWAQAGRCWCEARLADWDARMPSGPDAFARDEPTTTTTPELAEAAEADAVDRAF